MVVQSSERATDTTWPLRAKLPRAVPAGLREVLTLLPHNAPAFTQELSAGYVLPGSCAPARCGHGRDFNSAGNLDAARKVLEALELTEIEMRRNLALAELRAYETLLPQALAAMREQLERGGTVVPTTDVIGAPGGGVPRYSPIGPAIDSAMLFAIIRQESSFDPADWSSAQAMGLMQVTPVAGRDTCKRFGCTYDVSASRTTCLTIFKSAPPSLAA